MASRESRELVLVGGGHAHVPVLRRLAMARPERTRLTLVVDTPLAVYSGMVPGHVAGEYRKEEIEIDLLPLARRAGARVLFARAERIDAGARRIQLGGRAPIPYDVASFDIGATVAGLELPGVQEHALATRPIDRFVERVDEVVARARVRRGDQTFQVVVAGAGAGGIELALCLDRRLRDAGAQVVVHLVDAGPRLLPGYPRRFVAAAERALARRGIEVRLGDRVTAAAPSGVELASGEKLAADALIWATGAAAPALFRDSGLATDERGFVRVGATLAVEGAEGLFAAGDCASHVRHPGLARAGVHAVRQAPVLGDNLLAALAGQRLRRYRPQRDFLTLLNLGDGSALGARSPFSFGGRWVRKLKDRIDRRWVRRFQVLAADGEAGRAMPPMAAGMGPACGGCAAKLGQTALAQALTRLGPGEEDDTVVLGLAHPDDASAIRTPAGETLVSSIDAFCAFTDDPWLVGNVAAVNACSDLFAKGVEPRYARALVTVPAAASEKEAEEILYQVLSGARAALAPLGVTLTGGHTTTADELLVGFAVDALAPARPRLLRISRLEAGQVLVLTKALGTGVLLRADMQGRAAGPWLEAAIASMLRANASAARIARACGATAATDVTGFGLAGHLGEMLRASGLGAVIAADALPALPGAVPLLAAGIRSTAHDANQRAQDGIAIDPAAARHPRLPLLFDPQTSGGLLFGVPPAAAERTVAWLREEGDAGAALIGQVVPAPAAGKALRVIAGGARG